MALRKPSPPPSPQDPSEESGYDAVVEDSFPASDPPPGVIKVGPRQIHEEPPTPPRAA